MLNIVWVLYTFLAESRLYTLEVVTRSPRTSTFYGSLCPFTIKLDCIGYVLLGNWSLWLMTDCMWNSWHSKVSFSIGHSNGSPSCDSSWRSLFTILTVGHVTFGKHHGRFQKLWNVHYLSKTPLIFSIMKLKCMLTQTYILDFLWIQNHLAIWHNRGYTRKS